MANNNVREAHANATEAIDCTLVWDTEFLDTNYSFVVNGFDASGNSVEIFFVSRSKTNIVVRTLVNASVHALAKPYA